ncbi:MAG: hypothetical protein ABI835_12055 [Chloroflexota bacterium]
MAHRSGIYAVFGIFALLMLIGALLTASRNIVADDDTPTGLPEQIHEFKDNWQIFTVWFVDPVNGDSFWDIPKSFEDDGNIVARRYLTKVGTEHFCVDQVNQGFTQSYCVPFSNIAYIEFLPGNIESGH